MKKSIIKLLILCIFASNLKIETIKGDDNTTGIASSASLLAVTAIYIGVKLYMKSKGYNEFNFKDIWSELKKSFPSLDKKQQAAIEKATNIIDQGANQGKSLNQIQESAAQSLTESGYPTTQTQLAAKELESDIATLKRMVSGSPGYLAYVPESEKWDYIKNSVNTETLKTLSPEDKNFVLDIAIKSREHSDTRFRASTEDFIKLLDSGAKFKTAEEAREFTDYTLTHKGSDPKFIDLLEKLLKTNFKSEVRGTINDGVKNLAAQGSKTTLGKLIENQEKLGIDPAVLQSLKPTSSIEVPAPVPTKPISEVASPLTPSKEPLGLQEYNVEHSEAMSKLGLSTKHLKTLQPNEYLKNPTTGELYRFNTQSQLEVAKPEIISSLEPHGAIVIAKTNAVIPVYREPDIIRPIPIR